MVWLVPSKKTYQKKPATKTSKPPKKSYHQITDKELPLIAFGIKPQQAIDHSYKHKKKIQVFTQKKLNPILPKIASETSEE